MEKTRRYQRCGRISGGKTGRGANGVHFNYYTQNQIFRTILNCFSKPLHIISDTDLFKIDTNQQVVLTKTEKRKILASTLPKCYSMLQPHTEVPDPLIKRYLIVHFFRESYLRKLITEIE